MKGDDKQHTHDVATAAEITRRRKLSYSAGVMVLSAEQPHVLRYRSPQPVRTPDLPE